MKNRNKRRVFSGLICVGYILILSACIRKGTDVPPDISHFDPGLAVTHSIAALKAMNGPYTSLSSYDTTLITADVIIAGIVVADDRSGNFYKQIVLQDATGGITVSIDGYSLYNKYPVGRKLYIKCKGLYLGYDSGLPVLGSKVSEQKAVLGLVSAEIDAHIIRAAIGHEVKDTMITLAEARSAPAILLNRLVTITDVEFLDTSKTYTEPSLTTNRYLVNCAANNPALNQQLVMRSSNYATFHAQPLAKGHGAISGILTVYQASATSKTAQLVIRREQDVQFNDPRCTSGSNGPFTAPLISIDSVRRSYPGSGNYTMPSARIAGVIISDVDTKNATSGNFIIQDGSGRGVILYLYGNTDYKLGDSVVVDITGAVLKLYYGSLEIDNLTAAKIYKLATGKTMTPVSLTISALQGNLSRYESTLVTIEDAIINGGGTYSGNRNLTDATGTIVLRTATGALFANQNVPVVRAAYTGIPSLYNTTKQFSLRNLGDVR